MERLTVERVLELGPCPQYTRDRLRALFGDGLEFSEALCLVIPQEDRVWLACHWLAEHDPHKLDCWLDIICERAIRQNIIPRRIKYVSKWGRDWLDGEPRARICAQIWSMYYYILDAEVACSDKVLDSILTVEAAVRASWFTAGRNKGDAAYTALSTVNDPDWGLKALDGLIA